MGVRGGQVREHLEVDREEWLVDDAEGQRSVHSQWLLTL